MTLFNGEGRNASYSMYTFEAAISDRLADY